jgi:hypothetical protein
VAAISKPRVRPTRRKAASAGGWVRQWTRCARSSMRRNPKADSRSLATPDVTMEAQHRAMSDRHETAGCCARKALDAAASPRRCGRLISSASCSTCRESSRNKRRRLRRAKRLISLASSRLRCHPRLAYGTRPPCREHANGRSLVDPTIRRRGDEGRRRGRYAPSK